MDLDAVAGQKLLVLFDGDCGLCQSAVQFLLRRDSENRLLFCSNRHPVAQKLLERHGLASAEGSSQALVVLRWTGHEEVCSAGSEAVLACLQELPWPWPWLSAGGGWLPIRLRETLYRMVARNRFRWKIRACLLPTDEVCRHFLDGRI